MAGLALQAPNQGDEEVAQGRKRPPSAEPEQRQKHDRSQDEVSMIGERLPLRRRRLRFIRTMADIKRHDVILPAMARPRYQTRKCQPLTRA